MTVAEYLIQKGMQQGIQQGIQEGRQEGRQEKALYVVPKLLIRGFSVKEISEITGLSEKEILKVKTLKETAVE